MKEKKLKEENWRALKVHPISRLRRFPSTEDDECFCSRKLYKTREFHSFEKWTENPTRLKRES
jgi:hypothetical protein